jgi:hypothetical protein
MVLGDRISRVSECCPRLPPTLHPSTRDREWELAELWVQASRCGNTPARSRECTSRHWLGSLARCRHSQIPPAIVAFQAVRRVVCRAAVGAGRWGAPVPTLNRLRIIKPALYQRPIALTVPARDPRAFTVVKRKPDVGGSAMRARFQLVAHNASVFGSGLVAVRPSERARARASLAISYSHCSFRRALRF